MNRDTYCSKDSPSDCVQFTVETVFSGELDCSLWFGGADELSVKLETAF
jgi:hypothetical protein